MSSLADCVSTNRIRDYIAVYFLLLIATIVEHIAFFDITGHYSGPGPTLHDALGMVGLIMFGCVLGWIAHPRLSRGRFVLVAVLVFATMVYLDIRLFSH
jgi:hypothetical protein